MDLQLYKETLRDVYLVSNTPSFLYQTMRKSPIITNYLSQLDQNELFREFSERIKKPIEETADIAILYALLIALSYKEGNDIVGFFKYVKENIKFEWFSKIAEYYFLHQQPSSSSLTFQVNPIGQAEANNLSNLKVDIK